MTVIEHIEALEKCFTKCHHCKDTRLKTDFSEMCASIETAKSNQEDPVRVLVALSNLKVIIAGFRSALESLGGANAELVALSHETEAAIARDLATRSEAIWTHVVEKLRGKSRTYVREIDDLSDFGPALIDNGLLRLHIKTGSASGPTGGIDNLTSTCGVWICNPFGETCLCTEWECSGDGPSGSL